MIENVQYSENLNINIKTDLSKYYKIRSQGKKHSLDINLLQQHKQPQSDQKNRIIINTRYDEINRKQQFETINEYEEHKRSIKQIEYNQNSQFINTENNSSKVKYSVINENMQNSKLKMIINKKQSAELSHIEQLVFKDIKSYSGTNQSVNQSLPKIRKYKQSPQRLSRSLDSLLQKSIKYISLLKNEEQQCRKRNENKQNLNQQNNFFQQCENDIKALIGKKKRSNSVTDEVFGKQGISSIIDQLDNLSQIKCIKIQESQLLSQQKQKLIISKIKEFVMNIMNEYYSRQYFHCLKISDIKGELNMNNVQQFQQLSQFFNEEAAAKYILKMYKNRNILKKNYIEEVHRSKDIQIQFKECCLEGNVC